MPLKNKKSLLEQWYKNSMMPNAVKVALKRNQEFPNQLYLELGYDFGKYSGNKNAHGYIK